MSDREPVLRDCFKVKKGLCVTGDTYITGNLTLSGDFAWMNPDALLTIGNIETTNLSAGKLYSSNDELIVVPFGPDYTILHPLSVVDETVFESAVQMEDDLWIKGNLRVDGNAYLSAGVDGIINVGDTNTDNVVFNADIQSSLIPDTTDTYDLGSVDQHWNTLYVHDISAHGSVDIEDNLFVSGTTTLSGALSAGSDATLSNNLTVSADTTIGGTTTLSGALSAGSDVEIDGMLDVELDATLSNNLTVSANTTIGGNTTLSGTFSAAGDSKIDSDLHVVGDLRVDGDVWFNANNTNGTNTINLGDDNTDNVVFNADVDSDIIPDKTLTNTLGISSQQWLELFVQDISATGDVTISDTLNVSGDTNIVGDISATGDLTLTETLTVSSDTIIGGTTTLSGSLSASGDSKIDSDLHVVGDLRVDGDVWFNANNTNGTNTINLGDDNTDNVVFNADVSSNILPDDNVAFDLGSATQQWKEVHTQDVSISRDLSSNRHVNFPNLSAGGLSGNFASIQSDGELTTSSISVDAIEQIGTVVTATSANWDSVYSSVTATSANWDSVYSSVTSTSGEWDSVYSSVTSTSGEWDSVYSSVTATSGEWDSVYSSVTATSGEWDSVYSSVTATSANWNSVYATVTAASGEWDNPVLHNMTRSALSITTPYGPTGELIDWTPTNSTVNVSGWWDASDESTLTIQGTDEVIAWADKSTESNDLTVLNSSATGPLTGRTLNDLRVLEWNNTDPAVVGTVMERASFNWDQANIEMNVYMVIHFDDEGALDDQDFLFEGSAAGAANESRLVARVKRNGAIQVNNMASAIGLITEGNTYIITLTINGSNSLIRVNGAQVASGDANANPMIELNIGANVNEQQGLDGFIAEIVMTDDRSSTELIEGYLAHKWGLSSELDSGHQYKSSTPQYTVQDHNPEFLAMQSDSSSQDSTYPDINYTHAMVLPYDMKMRRVVMRGAATQGATVNVSVYSNRDETDPNTIEYKFFPLTPMETQTQTFTTNNEGRIFTFSDTSSANAGRTLGLSLSADRLIGHTNVTVSVEYNV